MYVLCWHKFPTQAAFIIFLFFFLLSVYSVYNILKIAMPKNVSRSKDVKKWPTDTNFQTPASTRRKVDMACASAAIGTPRISTLPL